MQPQVDLQSRAGSSAEGKEGRSGSLGSAAAQLPNLTEYIQATDIKWEGSILTHQQGSKATVRHNCWTIYGSTFFACWEKLISPNAHGG